MNIIQKRTIKYYSASGRPEEYFWAHVHEPPRKRTVFALSCEFYTEAFYRDIPGCFYQILLRQCNKNTFYALNISVLLFDKNNEYFYDEPGWLCCGGGICLGEDYKRNLIVKQIPSDAVDYIINYLWESKFSAPPYFNLGEKANYRNTLQEITL